MAATSELSTTLLFEDDTTATVTTGPLDPTSEGVRNAKANIINFLENNFDSATQNLVLSKYGNKWVGISKAVMTTTEKVTIF